MTPGGDPQPAPADPATGCPAIQLKAPDSVSAGAPARVSAIISGGPTSLVYTWKLSSGKITSGQHSPELVVDTSGLAGATITATLEIGGLATTCATTTANAVILIGPSS